MTDLLTRIADDLATIEPRRFEGRVASVQGQLIEATGPAEALVLGARCAVEGPRPTRGEIVGFRNGRALVLPFDTMDSIRPGARVRLSPAKPVVRPTRAWLGRVVDAFCAPVDGLGPLLEGEIGRAHV